MQYTVCGEAAQLRSAPDRSSRCSLIGTILACYATIALGRLLRQLVHDNAAIVRRIYLAKCVIVVLFTSLPLLVTVTFGLLGDAGKAECRQAKRVASEGIRRR